MIASSPAVSDGHGIPFPPKNSIRLSGPPLCAQCGVFDLRHRVGRSRTYRVDSYATSRNTGQNAVRTTPEIFRTPDR